PSHSTDADVPLHDAVQICSSHRPASIRSAKSDPAMKPRLNPEPMNPVATRRRGSPYIGPTIGISSQGRQSRLATALADPSRFSKDRKSTRLNSSHVKISYA